MISLGKNNNSDDCFVSDKIKHDLEKGRRHNIANRHYYLLPVICL